MSTFSINRKRNSIGGQNRSRVSVAGSIMPEAQKQNFNLDQNIDENINSIRDTIAMLKEYQKLCIQKEDFLMAQETKNKIQFLQKQQKSIQKQRGVLKQQQNLQIVCKQGQQEVQNFQAYWDQTIKNMIDQLKEIESNFVKQQQAELNEYKQKIKAEEGPKVKYSSKVLQLRKNLTNLIKMRKYKEADQIKNKLRALQQECQSLWETKLQDRIKVLVQKFQKKQNFELKALRIKLQAVFNEKIKQRDQKFEILLKRNRKRQIQSSKSKMPRRKDSLSTCNSRASSRVVLGNSKVSIMNCSTKC